MKKKLFIILCLFLMISNVKAECSTSRRNELKALSRDITYETSYSMGNKTFEVTFYNVFPGLLLKYNNNVYNGDFSDDYSVTIKNLSEGEYLTINVIDSEGCNETMNTIFITLPYYNLFFGTQKCEEYVSKLKLCSSKFLSYRLTEEILDDAIKSLDTKIAPVEKLDNTKTSTWQKIIDTVKTFFTNWGINIIVFIVFGSITVIICENIYRKVKHGI